MGLASLLGRKETAPDARSPLDALKGAVGDIERLPMFPQAATQAMEVANNPTSSATDFASTVEHDPVIAMGILRLANSPLYRIGRTIDTIPQAVVRLGMRECKNLIVATCLRSLFQKADKEKQRRCEPLWRHALITACLCRQLNTLLALGYKGEEFSCGLSHDLGRILFVNGLPTKVSQAADPLDFTEGPHTLQGERDVLGTDHCKFGAWFAVLNQLPGQVVNAIEFHHEPAQAKDRSQMPALVAAADDMANYCQRTGAVQGYQLSANAGWRLLTQQRPALEVERLAAKIIPIIEEAAKEADEVTRI
jgi:HD-like signal output (HDOD) protein